jgi:phage terminase large subunit
MVRKTLASLGGTALETWRKYVIPEIEALGGIEFKGASAQRPAQYEFDNGSVIVVGGMDKGTKIMSSEYDVIYVQEATELTQDDWELLTTRLRNGVLPYQQIIGDCNPDRPQHWLYQRTLKGQTVRLDSTHRDNPTLFDDGGQSTMAGQAYLDKLDRLTGVRRDRLLKGLWVGAEGMIYAEFQPTVHLIDQFEVPKEWTRYWSVDFGYKNPFVLQCWAEDPDGRLYLYREYYYTEMLVSDMAEWVLKDLTYTVAVDPSSVASMEAAFSGKRQPKFKTVWREPKPSAIICDHDAEGRATLERVLGATKAATKTVSAGIEAVQKRLRVLPDGKPRIFIMRDCIVKRDLELVESGRPFCTEGEIYGYVWSPNGDGEQPRKEDDHGMDGMRYIVAYRDLVPRGQPLRGFF